MDAETKTKTTSPSIETPQERARLLSEFAPRDRDLIERIMAQHPQLTAAEAIEALRNAGGL